MFSLSTSLRILVAALALTALMVMPVLADAPPSAPASPVPPKAPHIVAAHTYNPTPLPANTPVGSAIAAYPPCTFCGMYHPNPQGPRVPAPQLQGAASGPTYAPGVGLAPAMPLHTQGAGSPYPGRYVAPNGYVSYVPAPAVPDRTHTTSLGEVWMKSGGARLQYDALRGPIMMYTNGRAVKDPALVHLPPLHSAPKRVVRKAAVKKAPVASTKTMPTAKPATAGNSSHKLVPKSATTAKQDAHKPENTGISNPAKPMTPGANVTLAPRKNEQRALEGEAVSRPVNPAASSVYDGPAKI